MPLLQLVLFWFVFGLVVRIPVQGEGTSNFPLFLFGGLVPWLGINDGILRGAMGLTENAALLGRVSVPPTALVCLTRRRASMPTRCRPETSGNGLPRWN